MITRRTLLTAVSLCALGACAAAPQVPKVKYFRVTDKKATPIATPRFPGTLELESFSAQGVVGDRPLLYSSNGGSTLLQRNYAYWAETPTQMLRSAFLDYLRGSNLFKSVVTPEVRAKADYVLRLNLIDFYQLVEDDEGAKGSGTALTVDITLLNTTDDKLILGKSFSAVVKPAGPTIDEAAAALDKGLEKILADFTAALMEI